MDETRWHVVESCETGERYVTPTWMDHSFVCRVLVEGCEEACWAAMRLIGMRT